MACEDCRDGLGAGGGVSVDGRGEPGLSKAAGAGRARAGGRGRAGTNAELGVEGQRSQLVGRQPQIIGPRPTAIKAHAKLIRKKVA